MKPRISPSELSNTSEGMDGSDERFAVEGLLEGRTQLVFAGEVGHRKMGSIQGDDLW